MSICRCLFGNFRACLLLAAFFVLTGDGSAQKKKKAPPGPAQSPNLNMPLPMGIQRGNAFELQLTGANLADPVAFWTTIPGAKADVPADNNNGKDNAKLRIRLEVPKDTPLGSYAIRLATTRGISNVRLFCVDDLPQLLKDGKNTNKTTPQALPIPCVVAGAVGAESADYYKIAVQAGQRLSFDLIGRRLGSPFDPQITLYAPNGKELAYSNDSPGLQTDPRLTYTFKDAGEYLIEVRDVMHRGGADYVYRMRVGDFPCATTPIPMAAKRGSKVSVRFAGPKVENVAPVEVNVPADPGAEVIWVAPKGANGLYGWPVALAVSDLDEVIEQEPNNEPAKATRVPVPGAVTGQFHEKGDVDCYALALKKGPYVIQAHTLSMYSPTEVYMTLKNDKGAVVAATQPNDATKSSRIDFTAPADGQYTLAIEHLLYLHGPMESYRVTVTPPEPGFDVNLASDRVEIPQGTGAILPIQSVLRRDYGGPIELNVIGPPGFTGQTVITSTAAPPPPNQPNQPAVGLLYISAAPNVPPGAYPIKIQCKGMIDGKPVVGYANVRAPVGAALAGLPFPPRDLLSQVVIGVGEKPPFTLTAKVDQPEVARPSNTTVTITAQRSPGFTEEIFLSPIGLPPNVAPVMKNIPEGANEVKVELKVAANAPGGSFPISFLGRTKHDNKDFQVAAPLTPLVLSAPFDLKVEPVQLEMPAGGKVKIKVIAVRKANYQGPITLQFRALPKGVTAAAATIAQGKNDVEVELTAAGNASTKKGNTNVLGTATAAGNQQNASPNFTVVVVKK